MASFELVEPNSVEEAFALLDSDDPAVRPIGGGTALMLMMKAQMFQPARLVSLRKIPRLAGFSASADRSQIRIGAMTTFSELERSPEIAQALPIVAQTMKTLANVRVRNVATIGGNLAHGDPHLDLPPVWTALGARARILSRKGEREIDVGDLFAGYYETTLEQGDIIAEISVPVRSDWNGFYAKVTTRAEHDWPALGLAALAKPEGDRIADVSLVLSAAVDRPTRLVEAERVLRGERLSDALLARAGEAAVAEVEIESDGRGSAPYKKHLLRVHLARAIRNVMGAQA